MAIFPWVNFCQNPTQPKSNWQLQPTLTDNLADSWVWLCFHEEEQEEEQQQEEQQQPSPKKINFYITYEAEIWYVSLI